MNICKLVSPFMKQIVKKQPILKYARPFSVSAVRKNDATQNESVPPLIFRQLYDRETYTFTYLLGCSEMKDAIIIDPVIELVDRDVQYIDELGLNLLYAFNTHVHADHITGSGLLKTKIDSCISAISKESNASADFFLADNMKIVFGKQTIKCKSTPGHTSGCMTFLLDDHKMAFTGDALLVRGCGRTDFQQGDPEVLYDSVHQNIFSLPEDYVLYPGHDYKGFTSTTVKEEVEHNPRLRLSKDEFITFMRDLNLAFPKLIDQAVPANMQCGMYSKEALEGSKEIIDRLVKK